MGRLAILHGLRLRFQVLVRLHQEAAGAGRRVEHGLAQPWSVTATMKRITGRGV